MSGVFQVKEYLIEGKRKAKCCTKVPEEVRQKAIVFMEAKKKRIP